MLESMLLLIFKHESMTWMNNNAHWVFLALNPNIFQMFSGPGDRAGWWRVAGLGFDGWPLCGFCLKPSLNLCLYIKY